MLISYVTKLPVNFGFPYSISVEPTTRCNLHCTDCITGIKGVKRRQGDMSLEMFKLIIDQIHSKAFTVLTHFQGEPLLCSQIFSMVRYADSKRMVTEMATNATLINDTVANEMVKCGLKKVVITIDSITKKGFGQYRRGAHYDEVVRGIKSINEAKASNNSKYPLIVIELLALKQNISEIGELKNFSKSLGADIIRIKSAEILSPSETIEKIPLGTKYSRYLRNPNGEIALRGNPNTPCHAPWTKLSFTHDGWVVPCCFDKNAFYVMGSVYHWTIKEIWNSNHYNMLRKRLLRSRRNMPICGTCPQNRVRFDFNL
jgi:radical SAM protein with 4Fe4S-binding SPASM domain